MTQQSPFFKRTMDEIPSGGGDSTYRRNDGVLGRGSTNRSEKGNRWYAAGVKIEPSEYSNKTSC